MNIFQIKKRLKDRWKWQAQKKEIASIFTAPWTEQKKEPAILFFAPDAGVRPHLSAASILAKTMSELGHPVLLTRCFKLMRRCTVIDGHPAPVTRNLPKETEICYQCGQCSLEILGEYGLPSINLGSFLDPLIQERVKTAMANPPSDLAKMEMDGISFGRLAIGDLVLATKVNNFKLVTGAIRERWIQYIESGYTMYLLTQKLLRQVNIKAIVHYNDYLTIVSARLAAKELGIPCISTTHAYHLNVDRRRFVLMPNVWAISIQDNGEQWRSWRSLSVPSQMIAEAGDDILAHQNATWITTYSPPKTFTPQGVRETLGLSDERKTLVAYTSSLDEMAAIKNMLHAWEKPHEWISQIFENQIDWLQKLIAYVEKSPDLQLVVRIHPREGRNRRENVISEHSQQLREALDKPHNHSRIVWPEEKVSSYDLAEIADLALIAWSNIASELSRLGIPVLAAFHDRIIAFPNDDFLHAAKTEKEYFQKLEALSHQEFASLETIVLAFRWYHFFYLGAAVSFTDVVPEPSFTSLPPFKLSGSAKDLERVLWHQENSLSINHERLKKLQNSIQSSDEAEAVRKQLFRFIHFLATGEDRSNIQPFPVTERTYPKNSGPSLELKENKWIEYFDGEKEYAKYSPLVHRLGLALLQDNQLRSEHQTRLLSARP